MAKTTGASAVAERPTDALWLAALPTPRIARTQDRLPARPAPRTELAEGALAGLPGAVTDMAVCSDGRFLAAAHYGDDAVSVIDLDTLAVRATVAGITAPYAVAAAERIYVTSSATDEDRVVAVDAVTGVALGAKEVTANTCGLAVSPTGDLTYVARNVDGAAEIAVIDVESGRLAVIPVAPAATVDAVRVSADGGRIYAALTTATGGAVAVIDARSHRIAQIIDLAGSAGDIAVHRDGRRLFATGWDEELGGTLTFIDAGTGRVVESVALGALPTQVVLTGSRAYVAHDDEITVLALASLDIVDRIPVGRPVSCMAVSRDETRLYIGDFEGRLIARSLNHADARLRTAS